MLGLLSLNVFPDGVAEAAIEDVSKELEKLRTMATALKLTRASSINWTIFSSMTSDSASAQKRCTKLMKDYQDLDRKRFGQAGPEAIDIIENICAMHLGCNLRKAFLVKLILFLPGSITQLMSLYMSSVNYLVITEFQNMHMVQQNFLTFLILCQ